MAFRFGSDRSSTNQNLSSTLDALGNPIISSDLSFGASPLGEAARTQALYGIPNARFSLLPNDPLVALDSSNPLPYWSLETSGSVTATMAYDDSAQTWSVELDPTSAGSGDFAKLKTRTYLLNDSDLNLRQKAYASLTKGGTMATSQWALTLTATYYDETGTQLSSFAIGTVSSAATWTGISGFTTSGTAVVDAAASYADLEFALTASTAVTGTATAKLNSLLIQTSVTGGATSSFVITETITTSGDWAFPTGVDSLLAVVAIGGGGGGAGGTVAINSVGTAGTATGAARTSVGGFGGGPGAYALIRDFPRGTATAITIGIGAAGSGGNGGKIIAGSLSGRGTATVGGATTFGSFISAGGGQIGTNDLPAVLNAMAFAQSTAVVGAASNSTGGSPLFGTAVSLTPYGPASGTVAAAGAGSFTVAGTASSTETSAIGTANAANVGVIGYGCNGGGATATQTNASTRTATVTAPSANLANNGGGNGGVPVALVTYSTGTVGKTVTVTASNATPGAWYGAGGGGGGAVSIVFSGTAYYTASTANLNAYAGTGAAGAAGAVVIAYVA